ncbi:DUF3438 family protein [Hahella ganghwensis]|uniref:DUF3438 family protein n=1 Tax=Hahella ganghwensis TaxID=286420 RepID=UPI00035EBDB9|nr:DUF3438 family protein [Hahella ganghwensis]
MNAKMLVTTFLLAALFFSRSALAFQESEVEKIVWKNTAIQIVIPVGHERVIKFPEMVEVNLTKRLVNRSSIEVLGDGVVFWRANSPFEAERVAVTTASGYTYLLDIMAIEKGGPTHPVTIIDTRYPNPIADGNQAIIGAPEQGYHYVDIMRLAAQDTLKQVPRRLVGNLPGVTSVPVSGESIQLYLSGELLAFPLKQYKAPPPHSFYVTSVKLVNKMSYEVEFDPTLIIGDFIGSSPLFPGVAPAGTPSDTMVVLLVSNRSFQEAVNGQ